MQRLNSWVQQFQDESGAAQNDVLLSSSTVHAGEVDFTDENLYEHAETKRLVQLVKAAAMLVGAKGEGAFAELRQVPWFTDSQYVFVAELNGTGRVNPPAPEYEGKNLYEVKDIWGLQMIRQYLEELTVHGKIAVWVHYFGINPATGNSDWKSSFVMKAVGPDGTGYAVGSGLYNMKMERVLVGDDIQRTCDLIDKEGLGALNEVITADYFRDTFTFLTK